MAAVRVASTWSATAGVTSDPSLAGERPRAGGDGRGELSPLPGQRPQLLAVEAGLRLAQRGAHREHLVDLLGLVPHQQVDHPRGQRGLAQRLDPRGELLVAFLRLLGCGGPAPG